MIARLDSQLKSKLLVLMGMCVLAALYIVFSLVKSTVNGSLSNVVAPITSYYCFNFTPGQKNSLIHETELLESHLQEVEDQVF
jgi:hypothetical protein